MTNIKPVLRGARLTLAKTNRPVVPSDIDGPVVVLVHGLLCSLEPFEEFTDFGEGRDFVFVRFEYDPSSGLDNAGEVLAGLLSPLAPAIAQHGIAFVAHCFGGLVVRYFLLCAERDVIRSLVRGVVFLGTPHRGTLHGDRSLARFLDLRDLTVELDLLLRAPNNRMWQQLIGKDDAQFIEELNASEKLSPREVPYVSISGGLPELEMPSVPNMLYKKLVNSVIQLQLNGERNDGFVVESSSNVEEVLGAEHPGILHWRDYAEYYEVGHTSLLLNQTIGQVVVGHLESFFRG